MGASIMTPEDIADSRIQKSRKNGETFLDLKGLNLTFLPPSVGTLKNLTWLVVNDHSLSTLPAEIGNLYNLQRLELRNNRLTSLPQEIGKLRELKWLDVSQNQLTELPPLFGRLKSLEVLNLAKNQLWTLPDSLLTLAEQERLAEIDLNENPDLGIPPELLVSDGGDLFASTSLAKGTNPKKALRFYFAQQAASAKDQSKPLNEAKILVLGEAEVGKSSLIAALTTGPEERHFDKTLGIVQQAWHIPFDSNTLTITTKKKGRGIDHLRLNVWDFGGQEIYHATHTLFLTKRSIYLIVADARANDHQNNLDHWLQMAVSFGQGAPIWVAVNKSDQHGDGPDEQHLLRKYAPHLCGFIRTSAWHGNGIDTLTRKIFSEAIGMADVRQPMPKNWLRIKSALEEMQQDTIAHAEYHKLCQEHGETDEAMQGMLLDLWDKLGTVRHFHAKDDDPPAWKEMSILKPEWVTRGVYAVIDAPSLQRNQGILSESVLCDILSDAGYPPSRHNFIEAVMRRFDLLYDTTNSNPRTMLVPQLLSEHEPAFEWPAEETLRFVYRYDVLPAGLIPRFIARMHLFLDSLVNPWRNGCVISMKDCRARVTCDKERKEVEVSVLGATFHRRDTLDSIRHCFEGIHMLYKGLPVKEYIPVPNFPDAEMQEYEILRKLEHAGENRHFANIPGTDGLVEIDIRECLAGIRGTEKAREEKGIHFKPHIHIEGNKTLFQKIMGDQNTQNISHSTVHGDVVAGRMNECRKMVQNQESSDKKTLMVHLLDLTDELLRKVPTTEKEKLDKVTKNVEAMVKEVTSHAPDRKWYEASASGILDAAKYVADLSKPISQAIMNLGAFLWNDFTLPSP